MNFNYKNLNEYLYKIKQGKDKFSISYLLQNLFALYYYKNKTNDKKADEYIKRIQTLLKFANVKYPEYLNYIKNYDNKKN
jgi:hypothetical protein